MLQACTMFYAGLLLALALFAVTHALPSGRIVGGTDATHNQFPHQVSLRIRDSHNCGGSIISRNYVLTAAHCVGASDSAGVYRTYNASVFSIRAGSNDRFKGGVLIGVSAVVAHEKYGDFLNDIALLRVATPFIYSASIQPIGLATSNTPAAANIIISGWGRVKHAGDLPRYLQWNVLTSITTSECKELIDFDSETVLCLLHPVNNGACNGDSGGPAVFNNEVVGIAGFVVGGCGSTYPDGYARVYSFRDWIIKHSDL